MASPPPHLPDDLALEELDGIMDDWISISSPVAAAEQTHSEADSPDLFRLTNAVHMELQENAKLPTFHLTVDRSGSVNTNAYKPPSSTHPASADAAAHPRRASASLMESFLKSETASRGGRHANYAHFGVLKQDTTKRVQEEAPAVLSDDTTTTQVAPPIGTIIEEAWAAGDFDPTPLSEIKMRNKQTHHSAQASQLPLGSSRQRYFPRQYPLPIPTAPSVPALKEPAVASALADALSTAAAIACTQVITSVPDADASKNSTSHAPRRNLLIMKPPPKHAAAHAVSSPALQEASKQQSQYGFGRKHMVPSVPAAAPARPSPASKPAATNMSAKPVMAPAVPAPTVFPSRKSTDNVPEVDAYERKKQRAKNARIKLNESIDRLAIAINLAGTQSKDRISQFKQWECDNNTSSATTMIRISQDCVNIAENAKKWDRPSFVGSAASLIQGMNAQCEALMRKAQMLRQQLQEQQQQQQQSNGGAAVKHDADLAAEGNSNIKRRRLNRDQDDLPSFVGNTNEASLIDDTESTVTETAADTTLFSERTIMDRVASFLEPLSIVRCMRVSKSWKDWGVFSNDPLWQNLAAQRFGYFKVRQWKDRLDDEEMGVSAPYALLYKKMDAANEMPHFRHEGMFLLGEARLPGKVSAWTFLIERSNGETARSVKRPPTTGAGNNVGMYTSIPVVQLWTVIQNTGIHDEAVVLREQTQTVDASTRRRGEEMKEIDWDERFHKRILNLDGTLHCSSIGASLGRNGLSGELCRLRLFDAVVLETNIHARCCSTTSKFVQRSNFTKVLVQIRDGTTVPLVIPFPRDASHLVI